MIDFEAELAYYLRQHGFVDEQTMQCVILAGGLGTRMQPLTNAYPKALIEVEGLPFVHHQLSWLAAHGVTQALLCIGYRGEMIRDYVGDGRRWDLSVRYVDEGRNLRGTAGALRLALDEGQLDESFLYTYGDSFLPIDFAAVYARFVRCALPSMMCVSHNDDPRQLGNVVFDRLRELVVHYEPNRRDVSVEKCMHIDSGLAALRREVVIDFIDSRPSPARCDIGEVFTRLSRQKLLAGMEVTQRFYEIGSAAGFEELAEWLRSAESYAAVGA